MAFLKSVMNLFKWVLGFVCLGGIVAVLAGAFEAKVPPSRLPRQSLEIQEPYTAGEVVLVKQPLVEKFPGTVQAKHQTSVSSRILARIEDVLVRAGDWVESGSPLVLLDDRELLTRVKQAEEQLESARARFDEAETEYGRARNLFEAGVVPKSKYDNAERAYRVAAAQLDRAKQALEEARIAQTYSRIDSPITGRVIDRLAEPGDIAVPGVPLLKLYDPSQLRMETYVRESIATRLRRNDRLRVRIDSLDLDLEGTIEEMVPQADPGSRSLLVKIRLPFDERVFPGMFGRVLIPRGTGDAMYVPRNAVRTVGQIDFVYVLADEKPHSVRLIRLGEKETETGVEVVSGLEPGERVAVFNDNS